MGDITTAELRGELAELRRHVDTVEQDLKTRIAALEMKQKSDTEDLRRELVDVKDAVGKMRGEVRTLESLLRANHLAEIHLWGVTAQLLKLPDDEIRAAQQHARKLLEDAAR